MDVLPVSVRYSTVSLACKAEINRWRSDVACSPPLARGTTAAAPGLSLLWVVSYAEATAEATVSAVATVLAVAAVGDHRSMQADFTAACSSFCLHFQHQLLACHLQSHEQT